MPKYQPLADHLRAIAGNACRLRFVDIERVIGGPLPASAREHRSWWGNDRTHSQARAWMQAGFRAAPSPIGIEPVVFQRTSTTASPTTPAESAGPSQVVVRNLDPAVVIALKRRATRGGRSLEAELRTILTREARPDRSELIADADRIRAMTPGPLPDSTDLVRQDRDHR